MNEEIFSGAKHQMDYFKWIIAAIGGFVSAVPELAWLMVGLMTFDFFFSFYAAWRNKSVSPDRLWKRAHGNVMAILVVALLAFLDQFVDLMGIDLAQAGTLFYIGPALVGIVESLTLAGVPLPPQLTQVLVMFKEPEDKSKID